MFDGWWKMDDVIPPRLIFATMGYWLLCFKKEGRLMSMRALFIWEIEPPSRLITIFYKICCFTAGFLFLFLFQKSFLFLGNNETSYVHFLWRREKNEKRHPPPPSRPLYWAGVIDSWQKPPSINFLVWLSSLCPKGSPWSLIGWRMEKALPI